VRRVPLKCRRSEDWPIETPVTDREVALVRAGYERWNAGDVAGLAALCFSDDIEYQNSPEWPGQRTYRGAGPVARFLQEEVAEVIELSEIEIQRMDVLGDEILIELLARTRVPDTTLDIGKIRVFHLARVEDGKVTRVRVYLDEAQALEAARSGSG
jgi:ketosteroid isomerase-like protein